MMEAITKSESDISTNGNDVFLSICIPTYNRIDKTSRLVESILKYEGTDIEVVVLDNCSTDATSAVLSGIKDRRFKYVKNNENIGAMPNTLKSLTYGSGKYVLLCLDKDRILPENITVFIDCLKKHNIALGHCSLNSIDYLDDVIYNQRLESVLNIAYTSEHPSGLFIKTNLLKQGHIIDAIIEKYKTFAFLPELLKAEIAVLGRSARINMPFVYTETREECAKSVSHTYKGSNIYFMPDNIMNTFNIYIEHLYNQELTAYERKIVADKIYRSLLYNSVSGYKDIMMDKEICLHHGIMPKKIGKTELLGNIWRFNKNFFETKFPESILWKFKSAFLINAKLIVKTIIN